MGVRASRLTLGVAVAAIAVGIMAGPAAGHDEEAPWLDEAALVDGIYLRVHHPSVVRRSPP